MNWRKPEHSVSNLILHKSFIPEQALTTLWFCPILSNWCSVTESTELATSTQLPLLRCVQQSRPWEACVSCRAAMSCAEDRCPQPSMAQPNPLPALHTYTRSRALVLQPVLHLLWAEGNWIWQEALGDMAQLFYKDPWCLNPTLNCTVSYWPIKSAANMRTVLPTCTGSSVHSFS